MKHIQAILVVCALAFLSDVDGRDRRDDGLPVIRVSADGMLRHLLNFQSFADTSPDGNNRGVETIGFETSADYVADILVGAGYQVTFQSFPSPVSWGGPRNATSRNVIADVPEHNAFEKEDNRTVVMAGAHLDSVAAGPGINDNGSGSAALLEIALQIATYRSVTTKNRLRFAFWGAHEVGLVGSEHYLETLNQDELNKISVYLNIDMIASPNYGRFICSGEFAESRTPNQIDRVIVDYFDQKEWTWLMMRECSDDMTFWRYWIPSTGLLSTAGSFANKTQEEAEIFGGEAGQPYDPCYHQWCDNVTNINLEILDQLANAAAHAIWTFSSPAFVEDHDDQETSSPRRDADCHPAVASIISSLALSAIVLTYSYAL